MILRHGWRDRVLAYHEGDACRAERSAVAAHLLACAPCRELLRKLENLDALLMDSRPAAQTLSPADSRLILAQAFARSGAARQVGSRTWGMWTFAASAESRQNRGHNFLREFGRLKPGVTPDQADAAVKGIARQILAENTNLDQRESVRIESLNIVNPVMRRISEESREMS